ncbi:MAG: hypothetical protein IJG84_13230 [Kiritimatiellae bacterium]|nr:hypothetical protein [Kiritimatiellia bacterium]
MAYAEVSILQGNSKHDTRMESGRHQRHLTSHATSSKGFPSHVQSHQASEADSLRKKTPPFGIRTALAAERLKYELQKDGSYKVKVVLGSRQQFVYVLSDRTLESIAYIAPEDDYVIPVGWIRTLNRNCMVGGKWVQKEVSFEERRKKVTRNALVFTLSATEAVKSKELADAIRIVARAADDAEQDLSLESDNY